MNKTVGQEEYETGNRQPSFRFGPSKAFVPSWYRALKVLCSYLSNRLSKIALLRYLSEIRFQVLTAIYPRFTHESGTIRKKQAIDVSKLKRLLML